MIGGGNDLLLRLSWFSVTVANEAIEQWFALRFVSFRGSGINFDITGIETRGILTS
jgi:hypothetical protein